MKVARGVLVGAATTALMIGSTAIPADAVAAKSYRSCAKLQKDYKHGVGKKGAKDRVRGNSKPVTNFTVNTKVYNLNNGPHIKGGKEYDLDRDNDGVACEKR